MGPMAHTHAMPRPLRPPGGSPPMRVILLASFLWHPLSAAEPAATPGPCARSSSPLQGLVCANAFLSFSEGYRADSPAHPRSDYLKIGYYQLGDFERAGGELWGTATVRYFW